MSSCHLYAIGPAPEWRGKPILKIGIANDVSARFRDLQVGSPVKLCVFAAWQYADQRSARMAERIAHRHFYDRNSHGEWFAISIADLERFMDRDRSLDRVMYGVAFCSAGAGVRLGGVMGVDEPRKASSRLLGAPKKKTGRPKSEVAKARPSRPLVDLVLNARHRRRIDAITEATPAYHFNQGD